jgi:hypothetical protein
MYHSIVLSSLDAYYRLFFLENVNNANFAHSFWECGMKVIALKEHRCYCCRETINKGEECFAFIVSPTDPTKNEFDVIYTCTKCVDEEACRRRITQKSAAPQ